MKDWLIVFLQELCGQSELFSLLLHVSVPKSYYFISSFRLRVAPEVIMIQIFFQNHCFQMCLPSHKVVLLTSVHPYVSEIHVHYPEVLNTPLNDTHLQTRVNEIYEESGSQVS